MSVFNSKHMIRARIAEIQDEINDLEDEKKDLEIQLLQPEEKDWSENGIREMLRRAILSRFGSFHDIKMVVFRPNASDKKAYTEFNPSIDLIDRNFAQVPHDIDLNDFVPIEDGSVDELPESVVLRY